MGVAITIASISLISEGISEGSLAKELIGILGTGIGLGTVGAVFGPGGAIIGFTLGVGIGLIIDWTIKQNNFKDKAKGLWIIVGSILALILLILFTR